MCWKPASWLDHCMRCLTSNNSHPVPKQLSSMQQHFSEIIIYTSMSTGGRSSEPCLQSDCSFWRIFVNILDNSEEMKLLLCFSFRSSQFPLCHLVLRVGLWESWFIIWGRKMDHPDHWLLHKDSKFGGVLNLLFYAVLHTNYLLLWWYMRSILYLCHLELTNYIHLKFKLTLLDNCSHHSFTSVNMWFLMCLTNLCKTVV